MEIVYVGIGSMIGSLLRYGISQLLKKQSVKFPLATSLINLTGSFLLGLLLGLAVTHPLYLFLGTGVLGGYTTFSTMNEELLGLIRSDKRRASLYFVVTYAGGLTACFLGVLFGSFIHS